MAQNNIWFTVNLQSATQMQVVHGNFFTADNLGAVIGAHVMDGSVPAELSGTVFGYIIRSDGETVEVTGNLNGNDVSIAIPESAVAVPGPIQVAIRLKSGDVKTVLLALTGFVQRDKTGTIIDPGHVIPDIDDVIAKLDEMDAKIAETGSAIDAAEAAAVSANNATKYIAETEATSTAAAAHANGSNLIYNGKLYQATADIAIGDTLTVGTNIAEIPGGVSGQVTDLKSAFDEIKNIEPITVFNGTFGGTRFCTENVNIPAGFYHLVVSEIISSDTDVNTCMVSFYAESSQVLSLQLSRNEHLERDISLPDNITKVYFYAGTSYANSADDTFEWRGFVLEKRYNLFDAVSIAPRNLVPFYRSTVSYGVSFTWNTDNSKCTVSGTKTGSAAFVDIINTTNGGFPDGIEPGGDYYLEFSSSTLDIRLIVMYWVDGHSISTDADFYRRYYGDSVITLPQNITTLIIRAHIVTSHEVNGEFSAKLFAHGFSPKKISKTNEELGYLLSTKDTADRTAEIKDKLDTFGVCHLGPGVFYVWGLQMPPNSVLEGEGAATKIILLGADADARTAIFLNSRCSLKNFMLVGSTEDHTVGTQQYPSDKKYVARRGVVYSGTLESDPQRVLIDGLQISNFSGDGLYCDGVGQYVVNGLKMMNCNIWYCYNGIKLTNKAEFNFFTNVSLTGCHTGVHNDAGNNNFDNCLFGRNIIGYLTEGGGNNSHSTVSNCMFAHTGDNITQLGDGYGIKLSNIEAGQTFIGCQLFYSRIYLENCSGVSFTNFNSGWNTWDASYSTDQITIIGGGAVTFNNWTSRSVPGVSVTNNDSVIFCDCYTWDGELFDANGITESTETKLVHLLNLCGREIVNGTFSGTTISTIQVAGDAGAYRVHAAAITSTDTDDNTCLLVFSGSGVSTSVFFHRDVAVNEVVSVDHAFTSVLIYAADNYSRSVNDTFEYNSLVIENLSDLLYSVEDTADQVSKYTPRDLITNHVNSVSNGIKYVWDAEKEWLSVKGTQSGGTSIYNLISTINSMPDGMTPGNDYFVEFEYTQWKIRFAYSYWCDGKAVTSEADHFERITENTIINLPSNATSVRLRIDIPGGGSVDGKVRVHLFDNGFSNKILSKSLDKEINALNENIDALSANIDELSTDTDAKIVAIQEQISFPDDLLPTVPTETVAGMTFSLIEKGHYIVNGTATADNKWFNLILSVAALPNEFIPGNSYFLRYFTDDAHLKARVHFYDSNQQEITSARVWNVTSSIDFTVPEEAVGIVIRVANDYATVAYNNIHFEIAVFDVNNVFIDEIRAYQWLPRPMFTIIDDDGNVGFKNDLLPLIESKDTIISSSVPALYPALREITELYLDAKTKYQQGQMTEAEFQAIKAEFDSLRSAVGRETYAEDFFLNTMSWEEVVDCYEKGADILCHTYTHSIYLYQRTEVQIQREYQRAKALFEQHGIPSDVLVYAGDTGAYPKIRRACSRVFDYGIYSSDNQINYVGCDPHYIKRFGIGDSTIPYDLDTIKAQLDQLVMSKTGWMIWTIHTSMSWTEEKRQIISDTIDYAQSISLPMVAASCGAKAYCGNLYKPHELSSVARGK